MPGELVQVLDGDGGGGEGGEGGEGGVGPLEQRSVHSLAQAWYALGSLGQNFMHADKEPPGQPGDGGLGGEGGTGGTGGLPHVVGSGPWTTRPLILTSVTAKLDACKFPSPPQFPGTHPTHWDEYTTAPYCDIWPARPLPP